MKSVPSSMTSPMKSHKSWPTSSSPSWSASRQYHSFPSGQKPHRHHRPPDHPPSQRCAGLTNSSGRTQTNARMTVAPCEVKDWPHQSAPTQSKNSRFACQRGSTSIYNHSRQPHTPWSSETATSRGRPRDNPTARPETTEMTTSCILAKARLPPNDPAEYIDPSYVKRKKERVQYRTVKPEVRTIEVRICLIESCVLFQEQNDKKYLQFTSKFTW